MNIVFIVIDTLRYDHICAHGNHRIRTPNLDRLVAESWDFRRSFTASYPTIPHRTDVLTGRYGGPFHTWMPLPHDWQTFPELLARAGYCTQLIHDTPHLVNGGHNFDWPFQAWMPVRGAEVDRPWIDALETWPENWCRDPLFDFADEGVLSGVTVQTYARANRKRRRDTDWNAAKLFLTASEWLRDNAWRDRFFLWVDCFDPHEPWDVPPSYAKMYDPSPDWDGRIDPRCFGVKRTEGVAEAACRRIKGLYAAKVSWVDRWLGEFLRTLDETGLAERTAVVLTADHGTNVGEGGKFGKDAPVRRPEAHTPFMVRLPGGGSGTSDLIVQPQDVFATVLGLAGVARPKGLVSHDVLKAAQAGNRGRRKVALCGRNAHASWGGPDHKGNLFTVTDGEWFLEFAVDPADCRLTGSHSEEDVACANARVVGRLHAAGLAEVERRGVDPKLLAWLLRGGKGRFPTRCRWYDGWPAPAGFDFYWRRIYVGP